MRTSAWSSSAPAIGEEAGSLAGRDHLALGIHDLDEAIVIEFADGAGPTLLELRGDGGGILFGTRFESAVQRGAHG